MDLETILRQENDTGQVGSLEYLHAHAPVMVPYFVMLILALMLGTFGNFLVIFTILLTKGLRTVGNMFICNLAIADLCVSAFVDVFNIISVVHGKVWFDRRPGLCDMVGIICLTSCFCSLYSIGAVSFNRYVHICHNELYNKIFTIRNTLLTCIVLWVVAFLLELPNIVGWGNHVYDVKTLTCLWDRTHSYSYTLFVALVGISTPIVVITICYARIFMHVRASKMRVCNQEEPGTGNSGTVKKKAKVDKSNSMKLARTLFIIFVVFVTCWFPYAVIIVADFEDNYPQEVHMFAILVAHVNSSCNFFLYGVTNRQFRDGYFRVLGIYRCFPQLKTWQSGGTTLNDTATTRTNVDEQV